MQAHWEELPGLWSLLTSKSGELPVVASSIHFHEHFASSRWCWSKIQGKPITKTNILYIWFTAWKINRIYVTQWSNEKNYNGMQQLQISCQYLLNVKNRKIIFGSLAFFSKNIIFRHLFQMWIYEVAHLSHQNARKLGFSSKWAHRFAWKMHLFSWKPSRRYFRKEHFGFVTGNWGSLLQLKEVCCSLQTGCRMAATAALQSKDPRDAEEGEMEHNSAVAHKKAVPEFTTCAWPM